MTSLAWLIPSALFVGGIGLAAFMWALRNGQFDDLEGAGWRAIDDGEPLSPDKPKAAPAPSSASADLTDGHR